MGLTLLRQDDDIRKSDSYTDATAPSETNYETTPVSAEDDLNCVRSMLHTLLKNRAGNWYDDLNTPATFEGGAQRGVNDVNTDLHELERKRILRRRAVVGGDIVVPTAAKATGTLTQSATPTNNKVVVIGSRTLTWKTTLSVGPTVPNEILAEVDAETSLDNLVDALTNGVGGPNEGVKYSMGTAVHAQVDVTDGAGATMPTTAKTNGTVGNAIVTTTDDTNGSWGAGTLTGGAGDVVILGTGELPGNTKAAVGTVTTLGTVVAYEASFGRATLTEVGGGSSNLAPKNLCKIADAATGDPIVDGTNREIHALLQYELVTDNTTITTSTPNRVQLSFIVHNATNDDLELVDAAYIGGKTVDYSPVERYAFDALPEHAFLGEDFVDMGSTTATRQLGYDNQLATPVELGNNATLDLGTGFYWLIRDAVNANLFKITEGNTGGTTTAEVGTAVDVFNVKSIDNNFDYGASFDTLGTPIDVGKSAGLIERADDLKVFASGGTLFLSDEFEPVGWSPNGMPLSLASQEWTDFEANFGETSLLDAINQAYSASAPPARLFHELTGGSAIPANTDIGGPGSTAANLNVDWPDAFVTAGILETWVYLNGRLMRPGATALSNNDYYPGTHFVAGDVELMFERVIKPGDVFVSVAYA